MSVMTDYTASHGAFRATRCEWIEDEKSHNHTCTNSIISGKAYCIVHLQQAYRSVPAKLIEKEYDRMIISGELDSVTDLIDEDT